MEPSVEPIATEQNVEARRCAIEALVRGEFDGHTHTLLAECEVRFDAVSGSVSAPRRGRISGC